MKDSLGEGSDQDGGLHEGAVNEGFADQTLFHHTLGFSLERLWSLHSLGWYRPHQSPGKGNVI